MRFWKTVSTIILLGLFTTASTYAQEQLGLRTETYSGVNAIFLNPANNLSSSFRWDANLVSFGLFAETDYGYLRNTHVPEILRLLPEVAFASDYTSESQYPDDALIYVYNDNGRDKFFTFSTDIMGPSFMINLANGHSVGFFTRFRSMVSTQRLPAELSYEFFDRTPLGAEFDIEPFKVAGMAWSEIGINYAVRIPTFNGNLDIGASLKLLQGYEAFFVDSKKRFGLTQLPGDEIQLDGPDLDFGFTNTHIEGEYGGVSRNGSGIGIDLGAVWTIDGYEEQYQWKFGFSILDIGRINFRRNTARHSYTFDDERIFDSGDFKDLDDAEDILDLLSQQLLGSDTASEDGNQFGIWLPGALSLQADYHVAPGIFVGAVAVQRLPYQGNVVKRGNLLALSPRYEHRWFGASLPVSVYNWKHLRVGAALRLAFLTIGSDNLSSFVGRSNVYGSDIYVALKINPFDLNWNLGGGGGTRGKSVKCYEF